ncbi:protease FtsH subunit HflC [Magnetococcus marinus MC-1]|uniref:Protein HflC n=1 Tax=Magnetococcus marinus (strain ATCC BAA-1437 / JCM 17883 / MC-1) TaxID=156889 RepID=A0L7Z0_MAGMM|nr:protease modulator HflC [Magnetococcus marinus]ABK44083.1 protease FtsH subunit HflC [Magnetococcus marinus MC-1]
MNVKDQNTLTGGVLLLVAGLLFVLSMSAYTLHQTEQALVLQLGRPVAVITEPGLHFKLPLIQNVKRMETRLLNYDQDPTSVLSKDKKNLTVDNYARWRITDALKYYQVVGNEYEANKRLKDVIDSSLRKVLGQYDMMEIVSGQRSKLMTAIADEANKQAVQFGITIADVRIKRTDLPKKNEESVFSRMQTERQRQAKQYRAEGEEEARKIRSQADREREVILAKAYEKSEALRGEGDAESARIYADAFNKDPEFYRFLRTLDAYKRSILEGNTTLVLPPDGFFGGLKGEGFNTKDPMGMQ